MCRVDNVDGIEVCDGDEILSKPLPLCLHMKLVYFSLSLLAIRVL